MIAADIASSRLDNNIPVDPKELRILIVEDAPADAELCRRELERAGLRFKAECVDTREEFERALREFTPDLILSDFSMPTAFDGLTALDLTRQQSADVPFVFVSGTIGEDRAVEAMRRGATDYVLKDRLERLVPVIQRALHEAELRTARVNAENALHESDARLRLLVESVKDYAIIALDPEGRVVTWNAGAERIKGYAADEVTGRHFSIFYPGDGGRDRCDAMLRLAANGGTHEWEGWSVRKDGSRFWAAVSITAIVGEDGSLRGYSKVTRDITERRNQELRIGRLNRILAVLSGINSAIVRVRDRQKLFEEACRIAVEHGNFGVAYIDTLDPATLRLTTAACAGSDGEAIARIVSTAQPGDADYGGVVARAIREKLPVFNNDILADAEKTGGARRMEAVRRGYRSIVALPFMVGEAVVGQMSLLVKEPDFFDDEEIKLLTDLADDVSFALDHIAKEEKLNYLAYYDVLTGLPNRTLFIDRLEQRVGAARRDKKAFSVMMLDIERFRQINETLGRQAGDALLREFVQRLKGTLEETDVLSHMGGDYFTVATRRAQKAADVVHLLEHMLAGVSGRPFIVAGGDLRIAVRAGIAMYPADGVDAESLLRNAEAALKDTKRTGQRYLFYAPQMNARVAEQLKLENDLRRAVTEEQFVMYYQPRVDLAGGAISGFEALIRWSHPERGLVAPAEFVPVLESTGLILEVGRWALKRAALDHASWRAAGLSPPRIAVNVSAVQLRREEFVEDVRTALTETDGFQHIDIEITESMLMEDIEGNIAKLRALQEMGVYIALDDFGTGYCSLSYLAKLPINSLKIDRSFVSHMVQGHEHMAIVSTIISLARALNLKVVAEGVETQEQSSLLRLLRCDEVQGYLFARAATVEQVRLLIK